MDVIICSEEAEGKGLCNNAAVAYNRHIYTSWVQGKAHEQVELVPACHLHAEKKSTPKEYNDQ